MIFDLEKRFAFVHIPRCAGVAITVALRPHLSEHCVIDLVHRHRWGWQIRDQVGVATWRSLYRFAVIRPPAEIIESDWRLTQQGIKAWFPGGKPPDVSRAPLDARWYDRLARVAQYRDFDRFVREEYLGEYSGVGVGGFWRTWCGDRDPREGQDLGIETIRFAELPSRWPELCDRLGVPRCDLPRLNHAPGPRPVWPAGLLQAVEAHCAGDLARVCRRRPADVVNSAW